MASLSKHDTIPARQVVSFSRGKDSTAMLLMMLERGEPIHSVVFFDGGWEFPQMDEHMAEVERRTGIEIVRLKPKRSFDVNCERWGWPFPRGRWCTREKLNALRRYVRAHDACQAVGFAVGEEGRTKTKAAQEVPTRWPLIEWGVTEAHALAYCRERGYNWGGLYDIFPRVSCFCCPLQSLAELRKLRQHFPDLWQRMLMMDSKVPAPNRGFHHYATVHDLEARFAEEERQGKFQWQD
jgi:3'-phosphoadenosine 5'-phosphosulfate sulfotransferase (PAPS reductase)/FAD synthetase